MEQTTITIDIGKPMRLMNPKSKTALPISNVLFANVNIVFCEVRVLGRGKGATYGFLMFDRDTCRPYLSPVLNPPGTMVGDGFGMVENYELGPELPMSLSERAREFARSSHLRINQHYDGEPYIFHLDMAADAARKFKYLVPEEKWEAVLAGVYLHDSSEDSHEITFNPLAKEFGEEVANLAFACENEKGKTREERANAKYYQGIRDVPHATFIKLCDRIANISHGGSMKKKYRKENAHFKAELYDERYKEMFDHIEDLLA